MSRKRHRRASYEAHGHHVPASATAAHHQEGNGAEGDARRHEESAAWAIARGQADAVHRQTYERLAPEAQTPDAPWPAQDDAPWPTDEAPGAQGYSSQPPPTMNWGGYQPPTAPVVQGPWAAAPDAAAIAAYEAAHQPLKQRGIAGPVFLTALICLGGAGSLYYFKIQKETTAIMASKDALLARMDEQRNREAEARARAEQELKVTVAAYEEKLKTLEHTAPAAPAVAAPAAVETPAPVEAQKPVVAATEKARAATSAKTVAKKTAATKKLAKADASGDLKPDRVERATAKPTAKNEGVAKASDKKDHGKKEKVVLPKMAQKHRISDDPLGGLMTP